MKKIIIALLLAFVLILSTTTVFAEHYWNDSMKFYAANGAVNIDGKIDGGEWDDAQAIKMTLNNDPLDASGNINYQGEWDSDRNDKDFSGVYKIKWDENYIYFLEDRNDDYVCLAGDAEQPYLTDGTLIFTQVDSADGKINPDGISVHAFYTVGNGSGQIGGNLKARVCNMADSSRETVDIPGGKIASSLKSGGFIIEVAIPWAFYTSLVPKFTAPSAGMTMGLSYVVHDSDTDDTGFIKQLCYAIDNDNLGDVPGGYDFGGWGVLELSAPVAPPPEPEPEPELAADETAMGGGGDNVHPEPEPVPAVPVATAPVTDDNNIMFLIMFISLAAGILAIKKRNSIKVK